MSYLIVPSNRFNEVTIDLACIEFGISLDKLVSIKITKHDVYVNTFILNTESLTLSEELVYIPILLKHLAEDNECVYIKGEDDKDWNIIKIGENGNTVFSSYSKDPRRRRA